MRQMSLLDSMINFVVGTTLFELRCSYCVIGPSLLNPRPKDSRDEIALAKPVALAIHTQRYLAPIFQI